ncbi:MAG: thiamine phosphate synthase [Acidobacteriota bacterium]|nr:thiamine phosphate synthase [Acidobacteriota bacterium]
MNRPIVMLVSGGETLRSSGRTPDSIVRNLLSLSVAWAKAGVDIVQIREAWLTDRVLLELVRVVVDRLSGFNTKVVVNDRTDIALAANADGIHLKDEPLAIDRVRKYGPGEWLVGRSVHDAAGADDVCRDGDVDYLLAGTVRSTPSKPGGKTLGFQGLKRIAIAVDTPVLAIGGLGFSDSPKAARARAAGLAGIRLFMDGDKLTDEERSRRIRNCRQAFRAN